MDTQSLQAFVQVADSGSFSITAEQLHLTQPAVSKRIAGLESQLGCKLFDRIGRSTQLTEAGRELYPKALQILQDVKEAERSIRELRGTVAGTLSIGISHHIGLHRLPPVLQAYSKRYPKVHLDIDFMDSEEAHEQVMHGQIELGVVTLDPGHSLVSHNQVWEDELTLVVAADHPLTGKAPITPKMLSKYKAILPGLNTYTGRIVAELFAQHKLKLNTSMATNYLETIKMMVSIGLGWSVLPKTMLDAQLTALTVEGLKLSRKLGYIYHPNRSLSNAAQAFVDALNEHRHLD
ncbi:LysR family transcriptional regulator [Dasania sp. GY-MA-18]|uniref:LysR family transcriptional regulator n=1 Tax=Dasania phycosphaerae TaxID=2950436 RepID=A0A9J6RI54_9GAMM|nr:MULTISPECIES: LysR family transcriptional regulator [Dasania]MCR8921711.1 LysR family transcriptional regulator [Dasania sp. GY-MA-18]MCZ0864139.1 LysR family transcriptional regulator [Dasania phycosphaerae]MCZ0867867.1 LysR family transcriptional regulator [Dasania phycosphaerae]